MGGEGALPPDVEREIIAHTAQEEIEAFEHKIGLRIKPANSYGKVPHPRRLSHLCPLYISLVILHTKQTGGIKWRYCLWLGPVPREEAGRAGEL